MGEEKKLVPGEALELADGLVGHLGGGGEKMAAVVQPVAVAVEAAGDPGRGRQGAQGDDAGGPPAAALQHLRQQGVAAVIDIFIPEHAELMRQPPAEHGQVGGQGLRDRRIGVGENPGAGGEAAQFGGPGPAAAAVIHKVGAGRVQRNEQHVLDGRSAGTGAGQGQKPGKRQEKHGALHGRWYYSVRDRKIEIASGAAPRLPGPGHHPRRSAPAGSRPWSRPFQAYSGRAVSPGGSPGISAR